jgi:hypothetical protein
MNWAVRDPALQGWQDEKRCLESGLEDDTVHVWLQESDPRIPEGEACGRGRLQYCMVHLTG